MTRTPSPTIPPEPILTYIGLARADDTVVASSGRTEDGLPIFERNFGSGFSLVVEARRGGTNAPLVRQTFDWNADDPERLPGLQLLVSRTLGNGSAGVCDDTAPTIGGVPGRASLDFDGSQEVANSVNDLACRFKDGSGVRQGRDTDNACTTSGDGVFRVVAAGTELQYCGQINQAVAFPPGDTVVAVRVADEAGNVSAVGRIVVRIAE